MSTKAASIAFVRETARAIDRASDSFGWSNPIAQIIDTATAEEKRHRRGTSNNGISVKDAVLLILVRDFAAYISGERKVLTIGEVLGARFSAVLSCATLEHAEYGPAIRKIYTEEVTKKALALNYAELVA